MSDYPLPDYAASIWLIGDEIALCLPAQVEGARAHTIQLPATDKGMVALMTILRDRARASNRTIGTKAAPVQYDVEALLRGMSITKVPPAYKTEARPDLSLDDLDL